MNKLLQIVFNTDLRMGHKGLTDIARKLKLDPDNLNQGEFICFVNASKTSLKLFATSNTIAYFKNKNNRIMDPGVIRILPRFFNGTELNYSKALESMIKEKFVKK